MDQNKIDNIKLDISDFANEDPVFTEAQYKEFKENGLSDEEIATLEDAERLSKVVEELPENPEELSAILTELKGLDTEKGMLRLAKLAKEDPKKFIQVMAYTEAMEHVDEVDKD